MVILVCFVPFNLFGFVLFCFYIENQLSGKGIFCERKF